MYIISRSHLTTALRNSIIPNLQDADSERLSKKPGNKWLRGKLGWVQALLTVNPLCTSQQRQRLREHSFTFRTLLILNKHLLQHFLQNFQGKLWGMLSKRLQSVTSFKNPHLENGGYDGSRGVLGGTMSVQSI